MKEVQDAERQLAPSEATTGTVRVLAVGRDWVIKRVGFLESTLEHYQSSIAKVRGLCIAAIEGSGRARPPVDTPTAELVQIALQCASHEKLGGTKLEHLQSAWRSLCSARTAPWWNE